MILALVIVSGVANAAPIQLDHAHTPRLDTQRLAQGAKANPRDRARTRVGLDLFQLLYGNIHKRESYMARSGRLEEMRPTGNGRARGLVSSRESGRRLEARGFAPSADLVDVVEGLWIGRWDLKEPHVSEL